MGIFGKTENYGLRLIGVTVFQLNLENAKFFKTLQMKLGFDDSFMERIQKIFPTYLICKIEYYEDSTGYSFERAKVWVTTGKNTNYSEFEDPFYMSPLDRPFYFWGIKFWELLTEQEQETDDKVKSLGIALVYDSPMRSFIMHIDGEDDRFEKKNDSFVDLRPLQDKVTDEAIILQVKPYDFVWLKEYDDLNDGADSPEDPGFYLPTDYYRRWSNWRTKGGREKFKVTGIMWGLELYDFTKNLLPKLEGHK